MLVGGSRARPSVADGRGRHCLRRRHGDPRQDRGWAAQTRFGPAFDDYRAQAPAFVPGSGSARSEPCHSPRLRSPFGKRRSAITADRRGSTVGSSAVDRGRTRGRRVPRGRGWSRRARCPPAECAGGDGDCVLGGTATVVTRDGVNVTDALVAGAEHAAAVARNQGIRVAVLKSRSPSCAAQEIYDGSFGHLVPAAGATAALLNAQASRSSTRRTSRMRTPPCSSSTERPGRSRCRRRPSGLLEGLFAGLKPCHGGPSRSVTTISILVTSHDMYE